MRARGRRARGDEGSRSSPQASPQIAGSDGDDQDAHDTADQQLWKPGLDAGAGIGTGQAADAEGDAGRPVRGCVTVLRLCTTAGVLPQGPSAAALSSARPSLYRDCGYSEGAGATVRS
jgi:hypothetical protein